MSECLKPKSISKCLSCYNEKGRCSSMILTTAFETRQFEECITSCVNCPSKSACTKLKGAAIKIADDIINNQIEEVRNIIHKGE